MPQGSSVNMVSPASFSDGCKPDRDIASIVMTAGTSVTVDNGLDEYVFIDAMVVAMVVWGGLF